MPRSTQQPSTPDTSSTPEPRRGEIYVATESFSCEIDGHPVTVNKGERVREGHGLLKAYPAAFQRISDQPVKYDIEDASAAPGMKRAR